MFQSIKKINILIFTAILIVGILLFANFWALAANTGNTYNYAWGEKAGWIRFDGADSSQDYGVTVPSSDGEALTGYAWAEDAGWIRMSADGACVQPGASCLTGKAYNVVTNTSSCSVGSNCLSGYGWGEKTGWIHFAAASSNYLNTSASNYGVYIDSNNNFHGYAWAEQGGWIHFAGSCDTPGACPGGANTYGVGSAFSTLAGIKVTATGGNIVLNNNKITVTCSSGNGHQGILIDGSGVSATVSDSEITVSGSGGTSRSGIDARNSSVTALRNTINASDIDIVAKLDSASITSSQNRLLGSSSNFTVNSSTGTIESSNDYYSTVSNSGTFRDLTGVRQYTCTATEAEGNVVYLSSTDTVSQADADAVGTLGAIGFVVKKPSSTTCLVKTSGKIYGITDDASANLTPGTVYYVSTTAGKITTDPGSSKYAQQVGIAKGTQVLEIFIQEIGATSLVSNSNAATLTVQQDGSGNIVEFKDGSNSVFTISDGGNVAIFNISATTGSAFSVARDLAAASTDSSVISFIQDNTGDDQEVLTVRQDGTGSITSFTNTASATSDAFTLTNLGSGNSFLVEDSASADSTPFVIDADGNVGIGTASTTYKLEVAGKCVTGDTELITEDGRNLRIDQVKGGEIIYSLDQKTGKLVPEKITALLDMGTKPTFELKTASGKRIETTGNHPYLVKSISHLPMLDVSNQNGAAIFQGEFNPVIPYSQTEVFSSSSAKFNNHRMLERMIKFAEFSNFNNNPFLFLNRQTNQLFFSSGMEKIVQHKNSYFNSLSRFLRRSSTSFAGIHNLLRSASLMRSLVSLTDSELDNSIKSTISSNTSLDNILAGAKTPRKFLSSTKVIEGKNFDFDNSILFIQSNYNKGKNGLSNLNMREPGFDMFSSKRRVIFQDFLNGFFGGEHFQNQPDHNSSSLKDRLTMANSRISSDKFVDGDFSYSNKLYNNYSKNQNHLSRARWTKVIYLQPGDKVAIANMETGEMEWDEIVSIEYTGDKQVYDIEVQGTHNFVANGIIAHNTYINTTDNSNPALTVTQSGTGNALTIDQNGNVGTAPSTDGALLIENTGNTGIGLSVYSNIGATADSSLVYFQADNTGFDQAVLTVQQDGTGNIVEFQDGANSVLTLADGGKLTLAGLGTTASTTGMQEIKPFEQDIDAAWRFNGATYDDNTTEAGTASGTQFEFLADTSDYYYFGYSAEFDGMEFDLQTDGDYGALTWDYWNGSAWTSFTPTATYTFSADGYITWGTLSSWATLAFSNTAPHNIDPETPPDTTARYWVRVSAASVTTAAQVYQITLTGMGRALAVYSSNISSTPTFYIDRNGNLQVSSNSSASSLTVNQSGAGKLLDIQKSGTSIFEVGQANVKISQPLELDVAGDVGIDYDLYFTNNSLANITSAGTLTISAGDSNHYENLTLTTGNTGDVIIDIADSLLGFKVAGTQGGYVFRVMPSGDLDINSIVSNFNTPFGGFGRYQNLLTYSEELDNAAWDATNVTVTLNDTTAPDGETTAETLLASAANGKVEQDYNVGGALTDKTYIFSVWLKASSAVTVNLVIISSFDGTTGDDGSTAVSEARTATTEWQRFYVTGTFGTETDQFVKAKILMPTDASTVYAWGAQLEEASDMGVYVSTTSAVVSTTGRGLITKDAKIESLSLGDANSVSGTFETFTAAESKTIHITTGLKSNNPVVRKVQLYISAMDTPTTDSNINFRLSFYNDADADDTLTEDELIKDFYFNLTYTEIATADGWPTGFVGAGDTDVDSTAGLLKYDLIRLLDATAENVRITSVVDANDLVITPTTSVDTHLVDSGVVKVVELTDLFQLKDADGDTTKEIHATLEAFAAPNATSMNVAIAIETQ